MKRLLRGLLLLYPASHRRVYGEEMLAAALHRCARDRSTPWGRVTVVVDLALGALGVWSDRVLGSAAQASGGWLLDARFVTRSLLRSRGYTLTTIIVLAASVAAAGTVFSFVRGTLLRPPPYPDPERVLVVWGSNAEDGQLRDVVSGPAYIHLQRQATALESVAAFHHDAAYLISDGRPEVLDAIEASADFFRVLGVEPAMGRLFDDGDRTSAAPATVVVTHAFWRDRLDSDPRAVGMRLPFEGEPRTVIGVLPEGFEFLAPAPLFVPLRDDLLASDDPGRIHYNVLARLAGGATLADAASDVARAADGFADVYPRFEGWTFRAERLHEVAVESVRSAIWTLAATVSLVLLVALVNLATLFRIRALARGPELAVRTALGAGRARVARLLALETAVLAACGAALGLVATPSLLGLVAEVVPEWIAIPDSASRVPVLRGVLDPSVSLLAFVVAVGGALLVTAPSMTSSARGWRVGSERGVHGGIRGTRVLVGVEVAVATALCFGAGLLVRSADNLLSVDLGLEHEGLLTLYFGDVWGAEPAARTRYFDRVVESVEALPGVRRAGIIDYVDFQAEDDFARVYFLDRALQPTRDVREEWRRVDAGLFETAGMRVVEGRGFEPEDLIGPPRVAVVNEAFAAKHWPETSALGAMLSTHDAAYRDLRLVGVVANVHSLGPAAPPPPMLYVPLQGNPRGTVGLYVRVEGDPASYTQALREAVWAVDSMQPIAGIWPMSAFVATWVAVPRAARSLVLALAALTLFLSCVGVFGVVSYVVRARRSELGVRLALGATPERLEREQMVAMLGVLGLSLTAGVVGGLTAAQGARAMLHGVEPLDPTSLGAGIAMMGAAALLATYVPARRASRIDPTEAMRAD